MSSAVVEAANDLAVRLNERRCYRAAITMTRRSIQVEPGAPELWTNLGSFHWNLGEYTEAEAMQRRALSLRPGYPVAMGNLGLALHAMGRHGEALECLNYVVNENPEYHDARWDRALLNLKVGRYVEGWKDYEARIPRRPALYGKEYSAPMWQGEPLCGRSILVEYEQGIGDQIVFSRFLPLLTEAGASQIYFCAPQLTVPLLWEYQRMSELEFVPERVPFPDVDYVTRLCSLPLNLTRCGVLTWFDGPPPDPGYVVSRATIFADSQAVTLPAPGITGIRTLKVGVCWTGNPAQDRHEDRTIPLDRLVGLADDPRVWLYSLQVGPGQGDIARLGAEELVCDLGPQLAERGLVATGAVMQQLDLVVTCCTSVAHLAGALGVPCCVLLPHYAYWVWGCGETSAWWPQLKLFRQEIPGDWSGPISRAKDLTLQLLSGEE